MSKQMHQQLLKHMPRLIGLLFLYSGFAKLFHPITATSALETLGFGIVVADQIIASVTIIEIYLGIILVIPIDLRIGLRLAMGVMFCFSGFMFFLSTMANPPSCGCLGMLRIFESSKHEALFGLFRNCVLLWALKLSYDHHFPVDSKSAPGPVVAGSSPSSTAG